jgi:hypothetical protein
LVAVLGVAGVLPVDVLDDAVVVLPVVVMVVFCTSG